MKDKKKGLVNKSHIKKISKKEVHHRAEKKISNINYKQVQVLKKFNINYKQVLEKIKINHKKVLEVAGIISFLIITYFIYSSRETMFRLLKDKEILYYIFGGILIGMIIVSFIRFVKKAGLPKFKSKSVFDKKPLIVKSDTPLKKYETYLDQLFDWVDEKGSVDIEDISKRFGISRENAERWGKILEGHGLIKLHYHGLNKISFKKW